jgi:hypothetical protein
VSTERGRLHALTELLSLQDVGAFTLPPAVLTAAAVLDKVGAVPMPALPDYSIEQAADDVLADLTADRAVDLAGYADRLLAGTTAGQAQQQAQIVMQYAHDHARNRLLVTVDDHADRIVVEHLQPALDHLLDEAARHGAVLAGHSREARDLLTASSKVRTAWLALERLADRYTALRQARRATLIAGNRTVVHDTSAEFAALRAPSGDAFTPGTGAQPPRPDQPSDPVELLLWLVGPGSAHKPWLPTADQQDQAWLGVYGAYAEQRRVRAVVANNPGSGGLAPSAA